MWVDFIHEHACREPARPALVLTQVEDASGRVVMSYGDLDRQASRWSVWLHQNGVQPGDRVALLAQNRLEHLTLFWGCVKIGAIFAPLNYRLGVAELAPQLQQLEPVLFFSVGEPPCDHPGIYVALDQVVLPETEPLRGMDLDMDHVVLLLFTSGSTGQPKGVMLHAGMLLWNAMNTTTGWGLTADDVSVVHTPFFHTGGYNVTCLPLLRLGGCLVLVDRFDPTAMLDILMKEGVTAFFAVPTMFAMMAEQPTFAETDFTRLRFCISGGAPCPRSLIDTWRKAGVPLKQGFGLTEVGPNCFAMSDAEALSRPESVGRPMLHSLVKLVDEDGVAVSPGHVGELCIRGPHVCRGYWRNEDAFTAVCHDGYFHTGDLMTVDADGFYAVVGRRKDMYISGGENVYPGEVVRCLLQHTAIRAAAVVPVEHDKWGEVGFAFLVADDSLNLDDVRAFLSPRLSRYKHPHHLRLLDDLPLLPNNKLDVARLRAMAKEAIHHG